MRVDLFRSLDPDALVHLASVPLHELMLLTRDDKMLRDCRLRRSPSRMPSSDPKCQRLPVHLWRSQYEFSDFPGKHRPLCQVDGKQGFYQMALLFRSLRRLDLFMLHIIMSLSNVCNTQMWAARRPA